MINEDGQLIPFKLYKKGVSVILEWLSSQAAVWQTWQIVQLYTRARGYKTFFMLNSIEHESLNAYKYKNIKKFGFFRLKPRMLFFPLIIVKMPTIVGILPFMSRTNFMLS